MKKLMIVAAVCATMGAFAAEELFVNVNPANEKGEIKLMNAVNNGPVEPRKDQSRGNFEEYAALKIPYARIHDANWSSAYGGPHTVDITAIFPNFDADETKAESYDFVHTDMYLKWIVAAGTEPFFRLGQSIEHLPKKYGVNPPKDFAKWARICEHIVRHYNEGWANGFKYNIKYWEIWNEPTLRTGPGSPCWTGTREEYFELYKITSLHLRKCFGNKIKIGGPASHIWSVWIDEFLQFCKKENAPLDFYSWHLYARGGSDIAGSAKEVRKKLDQYGFTKTENHCNEWNYVKGWSDDWVYSLECESGIRNQKGAAFIAANLITCQDAPLDMFMFYDARIGCGMNNIFHTLSYRPTKGYYPFLAWRRLRELGTQVEATVVKNADGNQLYACAAKNKDNAKAGLFIARYHDNDNVTDTRLVTISLSNGLKADWENARCYVTDSSCMNTETPLIFNKGDLRDGTVSVKMQPNSFVYIEFTMKK